MTQDYTQQARSSPVRLPEPTGGAHAAAGLPGLDDVRQLRLGRHESQARFWRRFGVTQSSGSRFEAGLQMPLAVAILIKLYVDGKLSDADLPA